MDLVGALWTAGIIVNQDHTVHRTYETKLFTDPFVQIHVTRRIDVFLRS